jgi:hypothetical protein
LFFRRTLVAAFAALIITVPFCIWGAAVWVWQLSPVVFLAPFVLAASAATWLRVPDWFVDSNSSAVWLKVFAILALPLAIVVWCLPAARDVSNRLNVPAIRQIENALGLQFVNNSDTFARFDASTIVDGWITRSGSEPTKKQRATADRLVRLSESIEYPRSPTIVNSDDGREIGAVNDPDDTPSDFAIQYIRRKIELNQAIIREATELATTNYRFDIAEVGNDRLEGLYYLLHDAGDVAKIEGNLDTALEYYLAALSLAERLWSGGATSTHSGLFEWAQAEGQTSERVKHAIKAIDAVVPPVHATRPETETLDSLSQWSPPLQILATRQALRKILTGTEPSHLFEKYTRWEVYAAVVANELPFERRRALVVLDLLTINQVAQWKGVIWHANQQLLQDWAKETTRSRGEGGIDDIGESLRRKIASVYANSNGRDPYGFEMPVYSASTNPPYSWLRTTPQLRMELEKRRSFGDWLSTQIDAQVAAWGLRQQLALIAYRLDHGQYPDSLNALVPDYLPFVPIDPYSGRPFEYRPAGLPLELRRRARNDRVEPHTPLLWSVGPGNARLEIRVTFESIDPGPPAESQDSRREIYVFEEESLYRLPEPRVFPLPKMGEKAGQ